MWVLGPLGFTAPWLLAGLAALPLLWLILRAVPPAPLRRRFPGVALLVGLRDDETETERTPWWLLALRMAALAAAILGFAGPVLHPAAREPGRGPLLVLLDAAWSDAGDWSRRIERASALVAQAGREGRPVALVRLTDAPVAPAFQAAAAVAPRVAGLAPQPWAPDPGAWAAALPEGGFASYWLSDGLDHPGRAALVAALAARGPVTVFESPAPVLALAPPRFEEGVVRLAAQRLPAGPAAAAEVVARGPDPAGVERELARATLRFEPGAAEAEAALQLPPELRNRITRFAIEGLRSAGAVALADDSLRRRKVALVAAQGEAEALQLLSPLHYLRQALAPSADLVEGTTGDVLMAAPDVIVLADVARLAPDEARRLEEWVGEGGLLLRFAGPRTAAAATGQEGDDPLMPVPLRAGGRSVGGAMSWGDPRTLAPFAADSPFAGLPVPPEVEVGTQVLAQPGPELAARTIAALADGTPLVTRRVLGQGQVVLFHVTANAEWSNLPLSGLYVAMLERLAVSARAARPGEGAIEGRIWLPEVALDAFGTAAPARDRPGVEGTTLAAALERGPSAAVPPGLYAGGDRRVAVNAVPAGMVLAAAEWPAGVARVGLEGPAERALKGWFLAAAVVALAADVAAALALRGGLGGRLRAGTAVAALLLAALAWPAPPARAQTAPPAAATAEPATDPAADAAAVEATRVLRLAHVLTGDAAVDRIAEAGLRGLGLRLAERTTVEPGEPAAVDLETDELAFYPLLYWPVAAGQPRPSAAAYARLNRYLQTGGMIVFDTRDGDLAGSGTTPEARKLQELAAPLDIPPLELLPADHVLTRSFYLLQDFPGRFAARAVWVEAAPPDAEKAEGMPFRNLNDGVTPVVIGANDWAAAWAVDGQGAALVPVGRGAGGERQREIATRFGINLVMHVLTGNYKSDQVHVPALLERLGQ